MLLSLGSPVLYLGVGVQHEMVIIQSTMQIADWCLHHEQGGLLQAGAPTSSLSQ